MSGDETAKLGQRGFFALLIAQQRAEVPVAIHQHREGAMIDRVIAPFHRDLQIEDAEGLGGLGDLLLRASQARMGVPNKST